MNDVACLRGSFAGLEPLQSLAGREVCTVRRRKGAGWQISSCYFAANDTDPSTEPPQERGAEPRRSGPSFINSPK